MSSVTYVALAVSLNIAGYGLADLKQCQSEELRTSVQACAKIIANPNVDVTDRGLAYVHLGIAHLRTKKATAALESFSRLVGLFPKNATGYVYRGHAYAALRKSGQAIGDYNTALLLDPQNENAFIGLGAILFENGQHVRAIQAYDSALGIKPDNGLTLARRALAYHTIGKSELGLDDIDLASKLFPDHAGIIKLRKEILSAAGQNAQAHPSR